MALSWTVSTPSGTAPAPFPDRPPFPPRDQKADASLVGPDGFIRVGERLLPVYPRGDWSTGSPMLTALGTFWSFHFGQRGQLRGLLRGTSIQAAQTYLDYLEAVASLNRFSVPVFNRRAWHLVLLRESAVESGGAAVLKYGETAGYGDSYRYGVPVAGRFNAVDVDLERIGLLMNRLVEPSVAWVSGCDFYVQDRRLHLRSNPFDDSRFATRNVFDASGAVVDREIVLWAFDARRDWQHIYTHFGYVLRKKYASSENYRDFVNAFWNGLVGGLSALDLDWLLASIADVPVVMEAREIVEQIVRQPAKVSIVTDLGAYVYPAGSVPTVAVGDVVHAGQPLVDTVQVFDLANFEDVRRLLTAPYVGDDGRTTQYQSGSSSSSGISLSEYVGDRSASRISPPSDVLLQLQSLPVPPVLLGPDYLGSLRFDNVRGTIYESDDGDGVSKGRLVEVHGAEEDLDRFWATAHVNGRNAGETWLDLIGWPRPPFVNPAGFVIDNFLANHALVVRMRYSRFGPSALDSHGIDVLRRVLPPEKLLLYLLELDAEAEAVFDWDVCSSGYSSSSSAYCNVDVTIADASEAAILGDEQSVYAFDPVWHPVNACE